MFESRNTLQLSNYQLPFRIGGRLTTHKCKYLAKVTNLQQETQNSQGVNLYKAKEEREKRILRQQKRHYLAHERRFSDSKHKLKKLLEKEREKDWSYE